MNGASLPTGLFASVVLVTVILIGSQAVFYSSNSPSSVETYTINGLTCPVPKDYLSYSSVIHLLPLVTTTSRFQSLANGMPFVFGNAENITNRIQQIGSQPPVRLPDALEMVFYSIGPNTYCGMFLNRAENVIDVQVPIQNGGYNLTGATYNGLTPSGGPTSQTTTTESSTYVTSCTITGVGGSSSVSSPIPRERRLVVRQSKLQIGSAATGRIR